MIGIILLFLSGLFMGMMGSGGSILTLPLLLYIIKVEPTHAIPLSIGIVGLSAFIGLILKTKAKHVDWKKGFQFAIFSIPFGFIGSKLGVYLGQRIQIFLFLSLLLIVFLFMILKKNREIKENTKYKFYISAISGALIGLLTGIVGVGGGFFIVPVFLYAEHLSFQDSAGTSLFVIFINSLSALAGYNTSIDLPWEEIFKFGAFATIGMFVGNYLSKFIEQEKLRILFATSLIIVFIFTSIKEYS